MRSAERRVSCKGEFSIRRENTHAIVCRWVRWLDNKGGFRKIGPARHGLHFAIGKTVGIENNRQRIAFQRDRGEDINLFKTAHLRHERSYLKSALRALFYD